MNVRQTNLALQITAVFLVTTAVLSIAAGLVMPLDVPHDSQPLQIPTASPNHTRTLPPVNSFSPLFACSLQTPVAASANVAAAQIDPASSGPTVPISQLILVGTVGNSLALIKGPDGSIAMIEPGDDLEGSAVLAVRPSQVDLRINGKVTTLRMAPPADDSAILQTK